MLDAKVAWVFVNILLLNVGVRFFYHSAVHTAFSADSAM